MVINSKAFPNLERNPAQQRKQQHQNNNNYYTIFGILKSTTASVRAPFSSSEPREISQRSSFLSSFAVTIHIHSLCKLNNDNVSSNFKDKISIPVPFSPSSHPSCLPLLPWRPFSTDSWTATLLRSATSGLPWATITPP